MKRLQFATDVFTTLQLIHLFPGLVDRRSAWAGLFEALQTTGSDDDIMDELEVVIGRVITRGANQVKFDCGVTWVEYEFENSLFLEFRPAKKPDVKMAGHGGFNVICTVDADDGYFDDSLVTLLSTLNPSARIILDGKETLAGTAVGMVVVY